VREKLKERERRTFGEAASLGVGLMEGWCRERELERGKERERRTCAEAASLHIGLMKGQCKERE